MEIFAFLPAFFALCIPLTVSAAGFFVAYLTYQSTRKFLRTATRTEGTIVRLVEKKDPEDNTTLYTPVFSFHDAQGKDHEVVSSFSSTRVYRVGEHLPVFYQPEAPGNARLSGFFALWVFPIISVTIAVGSLIVGLISYFTVRSH